MAAIHARGAHRSFAVMIGNTDSPLVLSQDMVGPDDFADCPSCDMQDWSSSQQEGDLICLIWEACLLVGIYSEMAEVSTCPTQGWSSAHQRADVVNLFLQVTAEASSKNRYPSPSIQVDDS
jgi:hypothetical protein